MLNNSTALDADESAGTELRYTLPRLLRVGEEITAKQSQEGSDERPMTAEEEKVRRKT